MRATPEVVLYGDDAGQLRASTAVPLAEDGGLIVHCKVWAPASMVGRTVDVFFPASTIDDMLRAFRGKARDNRLRSGPQNDVRSPLIPDVDPLDWLMSLGADDGETVPVAP